ncbi:MAG TPA: HD domain-containing protein [bacterium]|nr:HD domain-containing protein [bacterium]
MMVSRWSMKKLLHYFPNLADDQTLLLEQAWNLAYHLHAGQKRKSGQPYFTHPLAVAEILAQRFSDPVLTAAALLHDTVEDCEDCLMGDIYQKFGPEVGFLVDAVTKHRESFYCRGQEFVDDIERLLWAGSQDVRCLLLKIVDRQHNLSTISNLASNRQVCMAFETQAILLPMKEILDYDREGLTINEAAANWQHFLQKGHFSSLSAIKEELYKKQFVNLDSGMYNLIYDHANAIIWQVTDKSLFEKLIIDPQFNQTADVLLISSDGHNFKAEFQFREGYIHHGSQIKLGISTFST